MKHLKYLGGLAWFFVLLAGMLLLSASAQTNPGYGFIPGSFLPAFGKWVIFFGVLLCLGWFFADAPVIRHIRKFLRKD